MKLHKLSASSGYVSDCIPGNHILCTDMDPLVDAWIEDFWEPPALCPDSYDHLSDEDRDKAKGEDRDEAENDARNEMRCAFESIDLTSCSGSELREFLSDVKYWEDLDVWCQQEETTEAMQLIRRRLEETNG